MESAAIIVLFVAIVFACPFVLYELAKSEDPIFFTTMESGDIRFIMKGKTLDRMIHDVRGKMWSDGEGKAFDAELVPGEEKKTWLQKTFGLYWIGLPPFYKVLKFNIKKTRENTAGTKPSEWISKIEVDSVTSFRQTFPLPFVLIGVELADRTKVDLMVVGTFEVIRPYIPVLQLKGDYYTRMSSRVLASTSDILKGINDLATFIDKPKKEHDGILAQVMLRQTSHFNKELLEKVGLMLTEISIPQYSADEAMVAAANKEALAKLEGAAVLATADFYKQKLAKETEADAARIQALGAAEGDKIQAAVNAAEKLGNGAVDFLVMREAAGKDSKLTTLVMGGKKTPKTVLPLGGNKP